MGECDEGGNKPRRRRLTRRYAVALYRLMAPFCPVSALATSQATWRLGTVTELVLQRKHHRGCHAVEGLGGR